MLSMNVSSNCHNYNITFSGTVCYNSHVVVWYMKKFKKAFVLESFIVHC